MYSIVSNTASEILTVYVVIIGSCFLLAPIVNLIISAIARGVHK
ncbi:hypothetical protein [Anaerobacillus alkalidiazotrophicus]|nr:hypothetical protein [Anaerobacillus alkalidiazotrophicus]